MLPAARVGILRALPRGMRTAARIWSFLLAATLAGACTDASSIEDPVDDTFLTDEAKSDAFGVEDWSPDGAAVLKLVSSATRSKLENTVGLSARVAKSIVTKRGTLPEGKYTDLAQLDAASYVGRTVFERLLRYVTEQRLFKTAIRLPLIVEGADGRVLLTSFNAAAGAAGVPRFARYTFVDEDTAFDDKMNSYDARLEALAMAAEVETGEMVRYAGTVEEYALGTAKPCYVGHGEDVPSITTSHTDGMMSDMYNMFAYRIGTTRWVASEDENVEDYPEQWHEYDEASDTVLMLSTATDSGDTTEPAEVPRCR